MSELSKVTKTVSNRGRITTQKFLALTVQAKSPKPSDLHALNKLTVTR